MSRFLLLILCIVAEASEASDVPKKFKTENAVKKDSGTKSKGLLGELLY